MFLYNLIIIYIVYELYLVKYFLIFCCKDFIFYVKNIIINKI